MEGRRQHHTMGATIERTKEKSNYWSIMLFLVTANIITGTYRDGFATLFPFLMNEFQLTRAQLGLHSTFFFTTSSFAALYSGMIIDKKGSKWGILFGIFTMGSFILLHSLAPSYLFILILASLSGIGNSMIIPATSKGVIEKIDKKRRSTAMGFNTSGLPIGGALAAITVPLLGNTFGWRITILIPALLSFLFGLLVHFFYENHENIKQNSTTNEKEKKPLFKTEVLVLLKNRYVLFLSLVGFFLGGISGTIAAHFTIFLYLDYQFSMALAGVGFSIVQIGSFFGRFGWGFLCDRFLESNKRKGFLLIGLLGSSLFIAFSLFFRDSTTPLLLIFILAFFLGSTGRGWHGLFFSTVAEIAGEEHTGIAVGFSLLFMRLGIIFGPPIIGYIADYRNSYDYSWLLLGMILLIISFLFYFLDQEKPSKNMISWNQ